MQFWVFHTRSVIGSNPIAGTKAKVVHLKQIAPLIFVQMSAFSVQTLNLACFHIFPIILSTVKAAAFISKAAAFFTFDQYEKLRFVRYLSVRLAFS